MAEWVGPHAWVAYLVIGALVGLAAGLLGIGGGMVMVPLLVFVFDAQGFPAEHALHVALGADVDPARSHRPDEGGDRQEGDEQPGAE